MAVGLARGGTVRGLRDPEVKVARLGLACLAVQCLVVVLPLRAVGLPLALGPVLLLGALATLVAVARPNFAVAGVPLRVLGLLLNLLVVLVNFGMPVPADTPEEIHRPAGDARVGGRWDAEAGFRACQSVPMSLREAMPTSSSGRSDPAWRGRTAPTSSGAGDPAVRRWVASPGRARRWRTGCRRRRRS